MQLRWNTTLGLIVVVAGSAVVAAVAAAISNAINGGRNNPLLGLGLVVASVGTMCCLRMAGELALHRAGGGHLGLSAKARLLLASLAFAVLTIGLSGLAFLAAFGTLAEMLWDPPHVSFPGLVNPLRVMLALIAATLAGLGVGFLVRRAYGPHVSGRRRIARLLAPLAIVVLLTSVEATRQAVVYRLEQLAQHDHWSLMDDRDSADLVRPGTYAWKLAEYHASLSRKWEYLLWHPWIPAEPDPPEPTRVRRPSVR